jgi:hypothetical protein
MIQTLLRVIAALSCCAEATVGEDSLPINSSVVLAEVE